MTQQVAEYIDFPSKVVVPQRPAYLVSRHRLVDHICSITKQRLLTVIAPAGYGKTSLLIDYATRAASLPVCWYSLDRFDDDFWTFLAHITGSIRQQLPAALPKTHDLLCHEVTELQALFRTLLRELAHLDQPVILIFDDWHTVDSNNQIVECVMQIVDHCESCHVILGSRTQPNLPDLMLLAARRQMSGLDEQKLQFSADEAVEVIQGDRSLTTTFDLARVVELVAEANGWITGILLLLEYQSAGGMPTLSGSSEQRVYKFLAEQVLSRQNAETQQFLLSTALLDELTVLDVITIFGYSHAALTFQQLLSQHMFVSEIRPGVLRYHPLFREFLIEHFQTYAHEDFSNEAHKVIDLYVRQQRWVPAFELGLLIDTTAAMRVLELGSEDFIETGRYDTVRHWLAQIPEDTLSAIALTQKIRSDIMQGDKLKRATYLLTLAHERILSSEDRDSVYATEALVARLSGNYTVAITWAEQCIAHTHRKKLIVSALRSKGIALWRIGDKASRAKAFSVFQQALDLAETIQHWYSIANLCSDFGTIHEESGDYRAAVAFNERGQVLVEARGNTAFQTLLLNNLAVVKHRIGQFREAHTTLQMAASIASESATKTYASVIAFSFGDIYVDLCLWKEAHQAYIAAQETCFDTNLMRGLDIAKLELLIREQATVAASEQLIEMQLQVAHKTNPFVTVLAAGVAHMQHAYQQADSLIQSALPVLAEREQYVELVKAHVFAAQIAAAIDGQGSERVRTSLDAAYQVAERIHRLSTLTCMTQQLDSTILSTLSAQGYGHAETWLQRHTELREIAAQIRAQEGEDQEQCTWEIRVFGEFYMQARGEVSTLSPLQQVAIVRLLEAGPNGLLIDRLSEDIWGDSASKNRLHQLFHRIKERTPINVTIRNDLCRLSNWDAYDYDVARFEKLMQGTSSAHMLEQAIELYQGDFLSAAPLSAAVWVDVRRARLQALVVEAHERLGQLLETTHPARAIAQYQAALVIDPYRQQTALLLIQLATQLRNVTLAQATLNQINRALKRLDLAPLDGAMLQQERHAA